MQFEELKSFIQKLYPIQTIDFTLDNSCITSIEFPFREGEKYSYAKIYYNKMLVSIKNLEPFYVTIPTHREDKTLEEGLKLIESCPYYLSEKQLADLRDASVIRNLNRPNNFEEILESICEYTHRSREEVLKLAGL